MQLKGTDAHTIIFPVHIFQLFVRKSAWVIRKSLFMRADLTMFYCIRYYRSHNSKNQNKIIFLNISMYALENEILQSHKWIKLSWHAYGYRNESIKDSKSNTHFFPSSSVIDCVKNREWRCKCSCGTKSAGARHSKKHPKKPTGIHRRQAPYNIKNEIILYYKKSQKSWGNHSL